MLEPLIGATVAPAIDTCASWSHPLIAYLVKPYTRRIEVGEGQFKDVIYPVASNVLTAVEDCEVQAGGLYNVAPHKGITHLIHISQESDISAEVSDQIPQRRGTNIDVEISVNVWIADHQNTIHLAKANIIKILNNAIWRQTEVEWGDAANSIFINKLKCRFVRDIITNPFGKYDFGNDQALQNQNYAAFGLVFRLTGLIMYACVPDYPTISSDACGVPITQVAVTITGQATITTGEISIISSTVTGGCGDHTFQWQKYVAGVWTNITGATSSGYVLSGATYGVGAHQVRLHLIHANSMCSGYSNTLTVTVS